VTASPVLSAQGRTPAWVPLVLLVILGLSWGLHFPLMKFAVKADLSYAGITALALGVVASALTAASLLRGRLPVLRLRYVGFYLLLALLGYLGPYFLGLFASARIDSGMLTIVTATAPVLTLCLAALVRIERVSMTRVVGIGLGILSVLSLVLPQIAAVDATALLGIAIGFGVPLCYSSYHVYLSKRWPLGSDSLQLACGEALAACCVMLPVFLIADGGGIFQQSWSSGHWAILAMAALTTIDCYLYFEIVRLAGPVFVSQANFVTVVAGVAWGMTLHGEKPGAWLWLSVVLLIASLFMLTRPRRTVAIQPTIS
jgi:drug/metabolite transporter (DMT)-like permease